jgi:hypothetical protein
MGLRHYIDAAQSDVNGASVHSSQGPSDPAIGELQSDKSISLLLPNCSQQHCDQGNKGRTNDDNQHGFGYGKTNRDRRRSSLCSKEHS